MKNIIQTLKLMGLTLLICSVLYPLGIWAVAQTVVPNSANGSLITNSQGTVVGSSLIAQAFTSERYLWLRPSAVDYNGQGAGGSNLAPGSTLLKQRAIETVARYSATIERPLPADLATASGSGLDPNISLNAALFQAERIALARNIPRERVNALIAQHSSSIAGVLAPEMIVNVLEFNIALDTAL